MELNQQINWVPEHIKDGRFGNWLSNNIDWALSRERYWGTPLPVWECPDCKHRECVGSIEELSEKAGRDLSTLDLHRPYVDNVNWACAKCGGKMTRVPDLIDVWFDSGSMPMAQWHYPFENKEKFAIQFPADYICEAVDQTRGWFYSLHAISTMLFDQLAFKNVICLGHVVDADGRKMSKILGTLPTPGKYWIHRAPMPSAGIFIPPLHPSERRFAPAMVTDVVKNFTLTLWNVYSFFVTYANLDNPDLTPGDEAGQRS